MQTTVRLSSGKGHRDENFPVASLLIRKQYRPVILAFYRFARAADDVADDPGASPFEKLHILENMWRTLHGEADLSTEATALRRILADENLSPQHALQLLEAFRRDVTKRRYANWDELMDYCRYSAMPVGRFVLDVHREPRAVWPSSDALCAALQVINHLQDCGKDYRDIDRVYLPLDTLREEGLELTALGETRASPALKHVIAQLAGRAGKLLAESRAFSRQIVDTRLALEVSVIQRLAGDLVRRLLVRDPLSERMHHRPVETVWLALFATVECLAMRPRARRARLALAYQPHESAHDD